MAQYFDRYEEFKKNGSIKPIPGMTLPITSSDKKVIYKQGKTRLDKLSQEYYGTPYFSWLILLCNPQFGGLEFDIPNNEVIVVPFPLNDALNRYVQAIKVHKKLNG